MRKYLTVFFSILLLASAWSQTSLSLPPPSEKDAVLPRGFEKLLLGASQEEIKELLAVSPYFLFRGEADVSLLSQPSSSLLDVKGKLYLKRGTFQFHEKKLFIITLYFDEREFDFFTLYSHLTGKYGNPKSMDPSIARWESADVRLSLEKPLSIRYVDPVVFGDLLKNAQAGESLSKIARDRFIDGF